MQRKILHFVEVEGCKYREVGEKLDMRVEAVKMVVFRARRRIASDMEKVAAG